MKEGLVVKACLDLLAMRGVKAWRQNTGGVYDKTGRFVRFGVVGAADITGIMPISGRRLEVECKAKPAGVRGVLLKKSDRDKAQNDYLSAIRAFNGVAIVLCEIEVLDRVLIQLAAWPSVRFTLAGELEKFS